MNSTLTAPPALPATTLAESCYSSMFAQCKSLTAAPALPATTLATSCYEGMFASTGLTAAPALPATTLADGCYTGMFMECTALTAAPALPATTLATSCYMMMFMDCTALTQIHIASPYSDDSTVYDEWLEGVSSSGTIYYTHPSWTSAPTGSASGVPTGWTLVKE